MTEECFYCHRDADGAIKVPPTLHPDERVVICQDCYCFIVPTLLDLQKL